MGYICYRGLKLTNKKAKKHGKKRNFLLYYICGHLHWGGAQRHQAPAIKTNKIYKQTLKFKQMAEKTFNNLEIWGESAQALIAKSGKQYVKATAIQRNDEGDIEKFLNLCFFPNAEDVVKLRDLLCKGRLLTSCVGNYSERPYVGKDGNDKIAYDLLVHDVKLGEVAVFESGVKTTNFSFIKESVKKDAEAELKKAEAKRAKAQAKPQQTTTVDMNDAIFDDLDL